MGEAILPVFDKTIQVTNLWLKALMDRMGEDDRHHAYTALRSTLQALRDRLPVNEAAHLGAQLPMLVRGFYYEGWHPAGTPVKERGKDEFVAQWLERAFGPAMAEAEAVLGGSKAPAERLVAWLDSQLDFAAQPRDGAAARLNRIDQLTIPQDSDSIGQVQNFIQAVRYIQDGDAGFA